MSAAQKITPEIVSAVKAQIGLLIKKIYPETTKEHSDTLADSLVNLILPPMLDMLDHGYRKGRLAAYKDVLKWLNPIVGNVECKGRIEGAIFELERELGEPTAPQVPAAPVIPRSGTGTALKDMQTCE